MRHLKIHLNIILSIFLAVILMSAGLFCTVSAKIENFVIVSSASCDSAASKELWRFILSETKLSVENANLHKIYASDCRGVFYDLDDDGVDEIIGTHYATGPKSLGYNIMYILKRKENNNYEKISFRVYFTPNKPVFILKSKTKEFHDLKCYNGKTEKDTTVVYSKSINKYVDESKQKVLEREFKEMYY